jgi:hypothetical protein
MKKTLLSLIILISTYNYAQINIRGKVIDSETKTVLPYTAIGIQGTNIGTVSDKNGYFVLNFKNQLRSNDTLQFSFIGYKTNLIQIATLLNKENVVEMKPKENQLEEVVLMSKAPKEKIIGRNHIGTGTLWSNFYVRNEDQDDKLGRELGMKFSINGDYRLKYLNFYIGSNEYNSEKFRLNIYKLDNDIPSELLNNEDIIFEVRGVQSEWFKVDLTDYNLYLEKELGDFVATIQWLESNKKTPSSKFFSIPLAINPLDTKYFREKGMSEWTSSNHNLSFYFIVDSYK